jgi:serpin B
MKTIRVAGVVGFCFLGGVGLALALEEKPVEPPAWGPAVKSVQAVGLGLMREEGTASGNVLLSPYSISLALGMTYVGAQGLTQEQMAEALHFESSAEMTRSFGALRASLEEVVARSEALSKNRAEFGAKVDPIALVVANRLFGQEGFKFEQTFLDAVKDGYEAPLELVDFVKSREAASALINGWVAQKTQDRIRDLVPVSALDEETRLILVNAIYLKAPWEKAFEVNATEDRPFRRPGEAEVVVPMMGREGEMGYLKEEGLTVVTIPYVGEELQFLIILPDTVEGLPALEKGLRPEDLTRWATVPTAQVNLRLPRFKLEPPRMALGDALKKLGMPSAFNVPPGSANFGGMIPVTEKERLAISQVFHQTFIDVNEIGTEAAAATAVVMMRTTAMVPPQEVFEVVVDRPFLFAIQHRKSGACLFLGRLVNPPVATDSG